LRLETRREGRKQGRKEESWLLMNPLLPSFLPFILYPSMGLLDDVIHTYYIYMTKGRPKAAIRQPEN
jgi:hypothetical protein